jgi:isochorismate pyruvate lyase
MSAVKEKASLQRLRRSIDRIDRRLVPLLAARGGLVRAVAGVKASPRAVRAPRRAAQVIAKVRRLARRHGMDPDLAARIYRGMIAAFIDDELRELAWLRGARGRKKGRSR